jgi:hypothetical protein
VSPILILAGIVAVVAGVRGTQDELFALIQEEFTGKDGKPGFGAVAVAVGGAASLGYVPGLRGASNALTALVFVTIIAANVRANNNPFQKIKAFVVNPN